jgi:hypothetical protein
MAEGLNVGGPRPATNPLPQQATFSPGEVINEISSAQKRMQEDRIKAENPGVWTRMKETVGFGDKKGREAEIRNAQKMDKIMDDLYAMVFKMYQAMINPQSASA